MGAAEYIYLCVRFIDKIKQNLSHSLPTELHLNIFGHVLFRRNAANRARMRWKVVWICLFLKYYWIFGYDKNYRWYANKSVRHKAVSKQRGGTHKLSNFGKHQTIWRYKYQCVCERWALICLIPTSDYLEVITKMFKYVSVSIGI